MQGVEATAGEMQQGNFLALAGENVFILMSSGLCREEIPSRIQAWSLGGQPFDESSIWNMDGKSNSAHKEIEKPFARQRDDLPRDILDRYSKEHTIVYSVPFDRIIPLDRLRCWAK